MRAGALSRSWYWLRPVWPALLLLAIILAAAMSSITAARWVGNSGPLLGMLWYGAIIGLLLALSRWNGVRALAYSLFVSTAFSLEAIGSVLPPMISWFTQPFTEQVWNMHLRALTLGERIAGWISTLNAGENITDTGLFVFLVGILLWNAVAWLAWSVFRRHRPLEGLLPFGFLLGANIHLSGQGVDSLWVFILAGLLLLARGSFSAYRSDWEQRRVDFPEDLAEWIAAALIIVFLLGPVIRLSPLIGSREGWEAISEAFERYRSRAAETSERLFSEVRPSVIDAPAPTVDLPDLNTIGGPIPDENRIVMWVRVSDPAPPPPEVAPQVPGPPGHYWRSTIEGAYTGAGWESIPTREDVPPINLSDGPPAGRYFLEQEFDIVAAHDGTLFAVNQPVMPGTGTTLIASGVDNSTILVGGVDRYAVNSLATRVTASELRRASTDYSEAIAAEYLQLPPGLPDRVRSMANRVAGAAENPYQKAVLLQDYLRTNYTYNEGVPPPPAGRDAVDYFLYEAQEGFCTYYASAMVVMLRAEGVPARIVSGYATGSFDYDRNAYRVAARNAHAWVEVYFPGFGWIEFEPTSALPPRMYPEGLDDLAYVPLAPSPTPEPEETASTLRGIVMLVGAVLGILLLAFVLGSWDRWQNQRALNPRARAARLYWQMRRSLGRAGLKTSPSTTPSEFLDLSAGHLAASARVQLALHQATDLYQQAEYSRSAPSTLAIHATHQAWQRAMPQWLLLWISARWKRLTSRAAQ
jgi:transglutaminase-like putative cysteine protease